MVLMETMDLKSNFKVPELKATLLSYINCFVVIHVLTSATKASPFHTLLTLLRRGRLLSIWAKRSCNGNTMYSNILSVFMTLGLSIFIATCINFSCKGGEISTAKIHYFALNCLASINLFGRIKNICFFWTAAVTTMTFNLCMNLNLVLAWRVKLDNSKGTSWLQLLKNKLNFQEQEKWQKMLSYTYICWLTPVRR